MTLPEFTTEMTRRGCVSDGQNFCGTFQSFPFALTFMNGSAGGRTIFSVRFQFSQKVPAKLLKLVAAGMKGFARVQPLNNAYASRYVRQPAGNTVFFAVVTVPKKVPFSGAFDRLIQCITSTAPTLNLTVPNLCPLCHRPDCDAYAYQGSTYAPVHTACVREAAAQKQAKVQKNQQKGSYLLGTLGALLGGLVGSIPTVLVWVLFETINVWILAFLCALVPLCAYQGYKLLRGKMTKAVIAIVVLDAALMTVLIDYLAIALLTLSGGRGFYSPIWHIANLIVYPGDYILSTLRNAFFMFIGLLMVLGVISRNNTHEWKEAAFSTATLRPINPAAAPAAAVPPAYPYPAPPAYPGPVNQAPPAPSVYPVPPAYPVPAGLAPTPAAQPPAYGPAVPAPAPYAAVSTLPPEMRDEAPAPAAEPPAGPDMD